MPLHLLYCGTLMLADSNAMNGNSNRANQQDAGQQTRR
jgi:hypothetical protein